MGPFSSEMGDYLKTAGDVSNMTPVCHIQQNVQMILKTNILKLIYDEGLVLTPPENPIFNRFFVERISAVHCLYTHTYII